MMLVFGVIALGLVFMVAGIGVGFWMGYKFGKQVEASKWKNKSEWKRVDKTTYEAKGG